MDIVELPLDPASLVAHSFESADYTDRFRATVLHEPFETVDQVARRWFKRQPRIIRLLSTNVLRTPIVPRIFSVGQFVGSWKVVGRTASEIVFGESTIAFDYHYSIRLVDPGT
ncbi:MAG: hypothetical protein HKN24_10950, partial [Acidimicrobiales bacterium]|nr:hypothetical protein [Acidimicrobiales bacterium]